MNNKRRKPIEMFIVFICVVIALLIIFAPNFGYPRSKEHGTIFSDNEISNIEALCLKRHSTIINGRMDFLFYSCERSQKEALLKIRRLYYEIQNTDLLTKQHIACEAISLTEGFMDYANVYNCMEALIKDKDFLERYRNE